MASVNFPKKSENSLSNTTDTSPSLSNPVSRSLLDSSLSQEKSLFHREVEADKRVGLRSSLVKKVDAFWQQIKPLLETPDEASDRFMSDALRLASELPEDPQALVQLFDLTERFFAPLSPEVKDAAVEEIMVRLTSLLTSKGLTASTEESPFSMNGMAIYEFPFRLQSYLSLEGQEALTNRFSAVAHYHASPLQRILQEGDWDSFEEAKQAINEPNPLQQEAGRLIASISRGFEQSQLLETTTKQLLKCFVQLGQLAKAFIKAVQEHDQPGKEFLIDLMNCFEEVSRLVQTISTVISEYTFFDGVQYLIAQHPDNQDLADDLCRLHFPAYRRRLHFYVLQVGIQDPDLGRELQEKLVNRLGVVPSSSLSQRVETSLCDITDQVILQSIEKYGEGNWSEVFLIEYRDSYSRLLTQKIWKKTDHSIRGSSRSMTGLDQLLREKGVRDGAFEPEKRMEAASRLDQILGSEVIVQTKRVRYQRSKGVLMEVAPGLPLAQNTKLDWEIADSHEVSLRELRDPLDQINDSQNKALFVREWGSIRDRELRYSEGKIYQLKKEPNPDERNLGFSLDWVSDGVLQRNLNRLSVLQWILGGLDAHAQNIIVHLDSRGKNVSIQCVDNDICLFPNKVHEEDLSYDVGKQVDLIPQEDRGILFNSDPEVKIERMAYLDQELYSKLQNLQYLEKFKKVLRSLQLDRVESIIEEVEKRWRLLLEGVQADEVIVVAPEEWGDPSKMKEKWERASVFYDTENSKATFDPTKILFAGFWPREFYLSQDCESQFSLKRKIVPLEILF